MHCHWVSARTGVEEDNGRVGVNILLGIYQPCYNEMFAYFYAMPACVFHDVGEQKTPRRKQRERTPGKWVVRRVIQERVEDARERREALFLRSNPDPESRCIHSTCLLSQGLEKITAWYRP